MRLAELYSETPCQQRRQAVSLRERHLFWQSRLCFVDLLFGWRWSPWKSKIYRLRSRREIDPCCCCIGFVTEGFRQTDERYVVLRIFAFWFAVWFQHTYSMSAFRQSQRTDCLHGSLSSNPVFI